ncbi:MAG: ClbS/DfsB family four-helix bundle protein [Propionibacteriaceae bacterium]
MPRPQTKTELLKQSTETFERVQQLLTSMSDAAISVSFSNEIATMGSQAHWNRDKNVRDVLIHLYEWHQLLLRWVSAHRAGLDQPFLPAPYTWRNYAQLNQDFWEKHQVTTYAEALALLAASHRDVTDLINLYTDDELFTKAHFSWTGSTSLGSYFISSTSSHYDWAIKKLRAHSKLQANATRI